MQKMKLSPQVLIEKVQIKDYLQEIELLHKKRKSSILKKIPVIEDNAGYFLSLIAVLTRPEGILEIGCGTGYSTYFLLKGLEHKCRYSGIDLNRKRVIEAEKFIREILEKKKSFSGKLNFIHGDAIEIIPSMKESFDLVFIDAAKFEYLDYLKSVQEKLNINAIIIADNIFYKNKIFSRKISKHDRNSIMGLRNYIAFIEGSGLFDNYYFNIGDGMVLSRYKGPGNQK